MKGVLQRSEALFSDEPEVSEPEAIEPEVMEPETVSASGGAIRASSGLVVKPAKADAEPQPVRRAGKDDVHVSRMAVLENQLQKELSMAAQLKAEITPKGGRPAKHSGGRGGFVHLFKS